MVGGTCQRCGMSNVRIFKIRPSVKRVFGREVEMMCIRCYHEMEIIQESYASVYYKFDLEEDILEKGKKIKLTMWD